MVKTCHRLVVMTNYYIPVVCIVDTAFIAILCVIHVDDKDPEVKACALLPKWIRILSSVIVTSTLAFK